MIFCFFSQWSVVPMRVFSHYDNTKCVLSKWKKAEHFLKEKRVCDPNIVVVMKLELWSNSSQSCQKLVLWTFYHVPVGGKRADLSIVFVVDLIRPVTLTFIKIKPKKSYKYCFLTVKTVIQNKILNTTTETMLQPSTNNNTVKFPLK